MKCEKDQRRCCGTCRYSAEDACGWLACHRCPPNVPVMDDGELGTVIGQVYTGFPMMNEGDWCGEWEPKAQDTTADKTKSKTKSDEISLSASQPPGFYRFPEITHPSAKNLCRTPFEQAQKVIEEAVECFEEAKAGEARRREMGVECMDAIHACETLLRRNFSDEEVAGLREACEAKNRARGFYG